MSDDDQSIDPPGEDDTGAGEGGTDPPDTTKSVGERDLVKEWFERARASPAVVVSVATVLVLFVSSVSTCAISNSNWRGIVDRRLDEEYSRIYEIVSEWESETDKDHRELREELRDLSRRVREVERDVVRVQSLESLVDLMVQTGR